MRRARRSQLAGVALVGVVAAAVSCTSGDVGAPRTTASPARPAVVQPGSDWPTYHRTADRAGNAPGASRPRALGTAWTRTLDGAVYAEPLVVGDEVIVATENDTLYGLDARTGTVHWRRHVGAPVPLSALPCGNIDPLGITGTPVYDPATRRVFAVAEVRRGGSVAHQLVGVAIASGKLEVRRDVDPPRQDPVPMQQRAALALVGDRVYVSYGGLNGDCGDYHGHVVGIRTDGAGALSVYRVPTPREGGIWGASGPAVTADRRLLVAVGNGASSSAYDGTDSVLALATPSLRRVGFFAPSTWAADNAADLDLGSMGPALLGNGLVVVAGKRGTVYLLRASALGGIGGELDSLGGCQAFGGPAAAGDTVYLPCTEGVRAVRVRGDRLQPLWRAVGTYGSPVVGGGAVWVITTDGDLVALDQATGRQIARRRVGAVAHFATPTLWGSLVLVPTARGVVAISVR